MARDTERLTIAWGIVSAYTRHPVQAAMDARVVQEAAGPGRFIAGFGTSKIFLNNTKQGGPPKETKPLAHMRDSVAIVRGALSGKRFEYDGKVFSADLPALSPEADAPRLGRAGLRGRDGAADAAARRRDRRRPADAVDHDAGVRRVHARERPQGRGQVGPRPGGGRRRLHDRRLDRRRRPRPRPRRRARDRRRCTSRTSSRTSAARPTRCSQLAEIEMEELAPVAEAMERGGRLAAKEQVSDSLLDRCKPIAGTPADCIAAIEEYQASGCTHVMLELWGDEPPRADPPLRRARAAALPHEPDRRSTATGWSSGRRRRSRRRASPATSRRWPS